MSLGITEIVLILVVVLLIFGGNKIPEVARGIGKAEAEYKKAKAVVENEVSELKNDVKKESVKTQSAKKAAPKKTATKKAPAKKAPAKKAPQKKTASKAKK